VPEKLVDPYKDSLHFGVLVVRMKKKRFLRRRRKRGPRLLMTRVGPSSLLMCLFFFVSWRIMLFVVS